MEELIQTCFEMNPCTRSSLRMRVRKPAARRLVRDDAIPEHADQKMSCIRCLGQRCCQRSCGITRGWRTGLRMRKGWKQSFYLLSLDKDQLTRDERNGVCETLIRKGLGEVSAMRWCAGMVREGLPVNLLRLYGRMLSKSLDWDDHLLYLTWYVFEHEKPDSGGIFRIISAVINGGLRIRCTPYRVLMQGLHPGWRRTI